MIHLDQSRLVHVTDKRWNQRYLTILSLTRKQGFSPCKHRPFIRQAHSMVEPSSDLDNELSLMVLLEVGMELIELSGFHGCKDVLSAKAELTVLVLAPCEEFSEWGEGHGELFADGYWGDLSRDADCVGDGSEKFEFSQFVFVSDEVCLFVFVNNHDSGFDYVLGVLFALDNWEWSFAVVLNVYHRYLNFLWSFQNLLLLIIQLRTNQSLFLLK